MRREEKKAALRLFDTPDGAIVMRAILREGCVTSTIAANSAHETVINSGMQRLALSIAKLAYGTDNTEKILDIIEQQENETEY